MMKKSFYSLATVLLIVLILSVQAGCTDKYVTVDEKTETKEAEDKEGEGKGKNNIEDNKDTEDQDNESEPAEKDENQEPDEEVQKTEPPYTEPIRGIYSTGHSAGGSRLNELINLIDTTDLNAMVVDVKDDYGYITYKREGTRFEEYSKPYIKDPEELIKKLNEHDIYPIARVVVFKDSVLAEKHPEYSYKTSSGAIWKNGRGEAFVNPFIPDVWKHNVEIAKHAAQLGFKEIQFDYVRFPEGFEKRDKILQYSMGEYENKKPTKFDELEQEYQVKIKEFEETKAKLQENYDKALNHYNQLKEEAEKEMEAAAPADSSSETVEGEQEGADDELQAKVEAAKKAMEDAKAELDQLMEQKPKQPEFTDEERRVQLRVDAVTDFVAYAKKELEPLGVQVSVDIFGYTATLPEAPGIGQNFSKISENVDVICSMIYPSHWGPGYFNIPKPDVEPYRLVTEYIKAEKEKLAQLENPPVSRPWIQDFTASWLGSGNYIPYGKEEVEAQIKALNEQGIQEFLIWNASNRYSPGVDYTPLNDN